MIIAVVIPCYKVKEQILSTIATIGPEVSRIYVIDDKCPNGSGEFAKHHSNDPRVTVVFHPVNLGVGGATMTGYSHALQDGADIIIKIDGDGQMDPKLIPHFVKPIISGEADYTKGNRFFDLENLSSMPRIRIFGNAILSFVSKVSSGYWDIMDPTNGYTAIHANALAMLPLKKIDNRYFFESDMLFRLNIIRAVIREIPMTALYADEESNLNIARVIKEFPGKYFSRFLKRIFYNYFLRDFTVCSIELISGAFLLSFGMLFGAFHWYQSFAHQSNAPTGTIMIAVLSIMMGFQLILAAVNLDVTNVPRVPIQSSLRKGKT